MLKTVVPQSLIPWVAPCIFAVGTGFFVWSDFGGAETRPPLYGPGDILLTGSNGRRFSLHIIGAVMSGAFVATVIVLAPVALNKLVPHISALAKPAIRDKPVNSTAPTDGKETLRPDQPKSHGLVRPSPTQSLGNRTQGAKKAVPIPKTEPQSRPLAASPPTAAPPDSDGKVSVSGLVHEGDKPAVFVDGVNMDSSTKPTGVQYLVVLVSAATRHGGSLREATVQSVVDALRKLPGLKVFFSDRGYQITLAGTQTGFYGLAPSAKVGSIYYFDKRSESIALQAKAAIDKLVNVKVVEYEPLPTSDIGIGTNLQEVQKVSGIDIEVIL